MFLKTGEHSRFRMLRYLAILYGLNKILPTTHLLIRKQEARRICSRLSWWILYLVLGSNWSTLCSNGRRKLLIIIDRSFNKYWRKNNVSKGMFSPIEILHKLPTRLLSLKSSEIHLKFRCSSVIYSSLETGVKNTATDSELLVRTFSKLLFPSRIHSLV